MPLMECTGYNEEVCRIGRCSHKAVHDKGIDCNMTDWCDCVEMEVTCREVNIIGLHGEKKKDKPNDRPDRVEI